MWDNEVIRLQIPGATEYVTIARRAIDVVGEQLDLSGAARAEVKLAVGEACNNAVQHASQNGANDGSVIVACRVRPDVLEIDVTNQGNGFHPGSHSLMPPAEALAEHGRGMPLMEMLMDSVEYLSENGNTTVRMRKKR
jgi:serine/threonine-protein kinase RsbW